LERGERGGNGRVGKVEHTEGSREDLSRTVSSFASSDETEEKRGYQLLTRIYKGSEQETGGGRKSNGPSVRLSRRFWKLIKIESTMTFLLKAWKRRAPYHATVTKKRKN